MKKLLVILLFIASWQTSNAQEASFGIKVGLSTNSLALDVDREVVAGTNTYNISVGETKVGFIAGFQSRFSFSKFLLMPELYFSSSTNTLELNTLNLSTIQSTDQTLSKLDIPVLAGYKLGPVRINAGPVASLILSEKNGLANLLLPGATEDVTEDTNNFTFGFQAGVGIDISKLAIDLRYEGNLSKLSDGLTVNNQNYQFDSRQRQILLTIGVLF